MGHTQEDDDSKICCVECNLDDMTPEAIGFAMDVLLENGALDVYTTPIGMKKNRPAVMLTCLCEQKDEKKFASLMLRHTTTLGVRIGNFHRIIMQRREQRVSTPLGSVRVKYSNFDAIEKAKPEYDDVRSIAIEKSMSFSQVYEEISKYI
jgi:hypothetical protein